MSCTVLSVNLNPKHSFSKHPQLAVRLLEGRGVQGDAHCGETVQHLYLKRKNAAAPNRMQVHLLSGELLTELNLQPGELGENVTTLGLDLQHFPLGTRLHLGEHAVLELTGLRTPCSQIDSFRQGLLKRLLTRDSVGGKTSRAGVMAVVVASGDVMTGDRIRAELPKGPHQPMTMI